MTQYDSNTNDITRNYLNNITSENITGNYNTNGIKQINNKLLCPGVNVSNNDLSNQNISNVNLNGSNLRQTNLENLTTSGVNFTNSNITYSNTKINNSDVTNILNGDNIKLPKLTGNNNLEIAYTQLLNTLSFTVSVWAYCYNDTKCISNCIFITRNRWTI